MGKEISLDVIKTLLEYDPLSGLIRWRVDKGGGARKGDIAGGRNSHKKPYIRIRVNGKGYLAHRIAWAIHYGYWPKQIDHINRVQHDNRICNLRQVSGAQNMQNTGPKRTSETGVKGVCLKRGRFVAFNFSKGGSGHIGYFSTLEDAKNATEADRARTTT